MILLPFDSNLLIMCFGKILYASSSKKLGNHFLKYHIYIVKIKNVHVFHQIIKLFTVPYLLQVCIGIMQLLHAWSSISLINCTCNNIYIYIYNYIVLQTLLLLWSYQQQKMGVLGTIGWGVLLSSRWVHTFVGTSSRFLLSSKAGTKNVFSTVIEKCWKDELPSWSGSNMWTCNFGMELRRTS